MSGAILLLPVYAFMTLDRDDFTSCILYIIDRVSCIHRWRVVEYTGRVPVSEFNVFHVRALYYTKNFKHQQMHKEFFLVNYNTLLHVSPLLGHLQGETWRWPSRVETCRSVL
jgi:hypothetical protein